MYIEATLFSSEKKMGKRKKDFAGESELTEEEEEQMREDVTWESYLELSKKQAKKEPIELECETCFDIFAKGDEIRRYFKSQQEEARPDDQPRFLSQLKLKSGYLSPTYLISGLLSEYNEDWTMIVNDYDRKMAPFYKNDPIFGMSENDDEKKLNDSLIGLRKLQIFIWDCWVQWGPSIPICTSPKWDLEEVALQLGYGDETNSLPICVNKDANDGNDWKGFTYFQWKNKVDKKNGALKVSGNLNRFKSHKHRSKYGEFSIDKNGNWSYALDISKGSIQTLMAGGIVSETFYVDILDSEVKIPVTIN